MFVLRVVFKTFNEESICLTLPLENDSSHRLRRLGHFRASGKVYSLYCTRLSSVQYNWCPNTFECIQQPLQLHLGRVTIETPLASRGTLKCAAMCSTDSLTSAKLQSSSILHCQWQGHGTALPMSGSQGRQAEIITAWYRTTSDVLSFCHWVQSNQARPLVLMSPDLLGWSSSVQHPDTTSHHLHP